MSTKDDMSNKDEQYFMKHRIKKYHNAWPQVVFKMLGISGTKLVSTVNKLSQINPHLCTCNNCAVFAL